MKKRHNDKCLVLFQVSTASLGLHHCIKSGVTKMEYREMQVGRNGCHPKKMTGLLLIIIVDTLECAFVGLCIYDI